MHISTAPVLFLGARAVSAFQDASPFMFFSTSELLFSTPQITTASSLSSSLRSELKRCPSNVYVIAQQPGVSSADFTTSGATPHLKRWVSGHEETVGSSFGISEVIGSMEIASLEQILEQDCGAVTIEMDASTGLVDIAKAAKPRVIKVAFQVPAKGEQRRTTLRENDLFLSNLIDMLPTSDYTVLYTTSPVAAEIVESVEEPTLYEMDHHMDPLGHMELKRDNGIQARATNDSVVLPEGPLFERYQFFTPAIFMGLITMAFLFSIIFVAVRGIAGLEVTYGAFEKDMSQQQQRKQQ